jgi:hypothetical protein
MHKDLHMSRYLPFGLVAPATLALFGLISANPAFPQSVNLSAAADDPMVKAAMSACSDDRARLCAYVIPGSGRIVRCLVAEPAKLSPTCKTAMLKARDSLVASGLLAPDAAPLR